MIFNIQILNLLLLLLQWLLIALPLPGYIHPDEYFQSTEIMATDILRVKAHKTWEWNNTQPARNLVFPIVSAGIPFWCLEKISQYFLFDITTPLVVITPRIMMGLSTFVTETFLKRLCDIIFTDSKDQVTWVLFLFRSSHVTLAFLNRAFSNSIELLLVSSVLLIVLMKINNLQKSKKLATSIVLDFLLGVIVAVGFFVRQSIVAFIVYPFGHLALLLLHSCFLDVKNIKKIFKFAAFFVLGVLAGSAVCIIVDNYYFSSGLQNTWPLTPLNLIRYNHNIENLKLHGLHPWYLHLTVNMTLLYGPLYFMFVWGLYRSYAENLLVLDKFIYLQGNFSNFMLLATLTPVCILSLVPHQEPRYIIPILVPLFCFVAQTTMFSNQRKFLITWILFNFLAVCWFGFLHQAGIYPSLSYLSEDLSRSSKNVTKRVIFWKTYKIPEHLLLLPKEDKTVFLHDISGASWSAVDTILKSKSFNDEVYLITPSSMHNQLTHKQQWLEKKSFFPHVSAENLPIQEIVKFLTSSKWSDIDEWHTFLKQSFALNIYQLV